jgi:ATP-dependent Clp protease ATP-binding subunit ClpA
MIRCSICKVNIAVVFVTRIEEGKQIQQALCVKCAGKQNIEPLNQIIEQSGMSPEELNDFLNKMNAQSLTGGITPNNDKDDDALEQNNLFQGMLDMPEANGQDDEPDDPSDGKEAGTADSEAPKSSSAEKRRLKKKKNLETYGINLTQRAGQGRIDKVIGRTTEIERLIRILNRRSKNNPVLIGEPGVGKTAIVEALAQRIHDKNVPAKLLSKELYLMDMTAILSGTQFRGQFESRMKAIIEEVKALGNIILFIEYPETGVVPRRDSIDRRHDHLRIPQAYREECGIGEKISTGHGQ